MTNIDFLPASYHERSVRRRTRYWRLVVVSAFSAILAAAAAGQFQIRRQLLAHMEAVDQQYAAVMAESNRLLAMQAQVREARAEADLYTYLRHPWPRTQIIAQLMAVLPESLAISKLSLRQEEANSLFVPAAAPTAGQPDPKAVAEAALPAAQRDLKRLRESFDPLGTSVLIDGTCQELPTLHIYLGALAGSELFAEAELRSVDRVPDGQPGTYRFQARLELRPGYGQPGGPIAQPLPEKGVGSFERWKSLVGLRPQELPTPFSASVARPLPEKGVGSFERWKSLVGLRPQELPTPFSAPGSNTSLAEASRP